MRITSNELGCMPPPCGLLDRLITFRSTSPWRRRTSWISRMTVARLCAPMRSLIVRIPMDRRGFIVGAAAQAAALVVRPALANVPGPYDWSASPPRENREAFVEWMVKNRGEEPHFLAQRFDRFRELIAR